MIYFKYNTTAEFINAEGAYFMDDNVELANDLLKNEMWSTDVNLINSLAYEYNGCGKNFVDVGTAVGTYTMGFGNSFEHLYTFESNKHLYNIMCGNIALHDLSEKTNTFNIGLSDYNDCDVKILDNFNISNIGLIKIDVNGNERNVLLGANETIKNSNHPDILIKTLDPNESDDFSVKILRNNTRNELLITLMDYRYSVEWLNNEMIMCKYYD